uniref:Acyl-coenzyme A oxidase n=1 Tax=Spongospora subterranea TaxID=70186 RepID=A0A0H5R7L3_9EUKA|eukprot:CRZ09796.1 hypothetical protein [Spongospora subterranea]
MSRRLQTVVGQCQQEEQEEQISANAASALFGPSAQTLAAIRRHLPAVVREALPFSGIKLSKDLTFDTNLMWQTLDVYYLDVRKAAFEVLCNHPVLQPKHTIGLPLVEQRAIVVSQMKVFAECKFFRFQEIYENPIRWLTCVELLYYHGITLATKFGVNFGLFGGTMMNLGSDAQRIQYGDDIANMTMLGAFGLTELGHGSNARDIETISTYDSSTEEFILNTPTETAQKIFIGNLACHGNHAAVFAQLIVNGVHHGVHVFVVKLREGDGTLSKGVRIQDCGIKSGLQGVDNGRLWLDNKRVPRDALLQRFGAVTPEGKYVSDIAHNGIRFTTMIGALVSGRIAVAQGAVNIAKVCLTIAVRYSLTRRQFGPSGQKEVPLMGYLSHQRRLLPLVAKAYALQFALNYAKDIFGNDPDPKELHILAASLKPAATWFRTKVAQECREATGGLGFMACNRIGPLMNDANIDVTWEGDNNVLLQQVATSLLKEFRMQVNSGRGFVGMLSFFAQQLNMEVRDTNPITKSRSSESHLRDADFFRHAMEYREARLLRALVHKLNRFSNLDSFDAWNRCLDLVNELGKAHIDRVVIVQFTAAVEAADPSLKPMLHTLCALHSLWVIQENMGFFMTFNYFSQLKVKAIWNEINRLLAALRPYADKLVDGFGIPEKLIDAPIAGDWVKAYSYPQVPNGAGR